jgi:hypothetical protein
MPANAPKAATSNVIPVRLSVLVHIDTDKWTAQAEATAPTVDEAAVLAGLTAAGIDAEQAKTMVAQLTAPKASASGPAAVRTEVREYVLAAVTQLEKLTAAGATVVDADRQPAKAKATK